MPTASIQAYATELYLDDLLDAEYYDNNIQVFADLLTLADFCSPLHSRDLDGRGLYKKSHYHIMYSKTVDKQTIKALYSNIRTIYVPFGLTDIYIEPIYKRDIYYQYLTHSDGKSRLNPFKADYTNERLLWVHPCADIPHPPVDFQQMLRGLYNTACTGYSYSDFLMYVDTYYPDLTQVRDLYLPTFKGFVDDRYKQFTVSTGFSRVDAIKEHNHLLNESATKKLLGE